MSKVVLIGSPNSGKSLLFNKLTGLNQKVANFPGVTVDISRGQALANPAIQVVDFPGVYSLHTLSAEEQIAVDNFHRLMTSGELDAVVCVLDSTRLAKGMIFVQQVIDACREHGKPVLIAANMQDVLTRNQLTMDLPGLSQALGVPVVGVSAKSGQGLDQLVALFQSHRTAPTTDDRADLLAVDEVAIRNRAHDIAERFGPKGDILIRHQNRLDRFFLSSFSGGLSFLAIMYLLFQSIFTWAAPMMDGVETAIGYVAELFLPLISNTMLHDFVADALFGGIGSFLVFVPQIFVLTLVVGILEDSGYLARAAVICHRPLRMFGLTGKSFVPMLSGVACAIPGIYAARTVDSPTKRWLTYLAIPLMPCSARLPVYTLLIAAFIPAQTIFGGLLGIQGLAMFGVYLFGIFCALLVTALVSRRVEHGRDDLPFVLEMPPYRLPSWRPLLRGAWNRSKLFVTKAGAIIFSVTVVVWFLGYFPNQGEDLGSSFLGIMGHTLEPVFEPLGLDWKYGVAILTSFLAREVFVGTLGTLFGIEGADENIASLADQIQATGLGLGSGVALLVFYAIALQCVSTLAVLRRESGGWGLPLKMAVGYGVLAYLASWLTVTLFAVF